MNKKEKTWAIIGIIIVLVASIPFPGYMLFGVFLPSHGWWVVFKPDEKKDDAA